MNTQIENLCATGSDDAPFLQRLLKSRSFDLFINALIFVNAAIIGAQTYTESLAQWEARSGIPVLDLLRQLDSIILGIFCFEILLKVWVQRRDFFSDRWNLFDVVIVGASLLAQHPAFAAIRTLRVLRIVRLFTRFRVLRLITAVMVRSIAGCFWIGVMTLLVMFVFAIVGCELFGTTNPEYFGNLHGAINTLFRIGVLMVYDEVVDAVVPHHPAFYIYIIPYLLLMYLGLINFFSAIILYLLYEVSFEELKGEAPKPEEAAEVAAAGDAGLPTQSLIEVLEELRQLRQEMVALKGDRT